VKHVQTDVAELMTLFCQMCSLQRNAKCALRLPSLPWTRTLLDTASRCGGFRTVEHVIHRDLKRAYSYRTQAVARTGARPHVHDLSTRAHCGRTVRG
jgi:hypothetical protein